MAAHFTIGELARRAQVPVSTVRHYERKGLLRPGARSAANYRLYSREELERLRFIRAAQATGFTLDDIAQLLRPASCTRVQDMIEARLAQVEARMRELRALRRVLRGAHDACRRHAPSGRCAVVDDLSRRARRS